MKQDGQRAMIYLPGDGTVLMRARSDTDITSTYPELLPLAGALGGRPTVLDGEIVALDEQGQSDFERLQQRMGLASSPAKATRMAARVPAHLMVFDVVYLDGRLLTGLPYAVRRGLLEDLGLAGPSWSTPAAIIGHGAQAWETVLAAGLEGLLAKRLDSRYEPGVRSKSWLKIKVHRLADVVVGGWVPGRGRLAGLPGAVMVGERRDRLLHYVGSVGTGWNEAERARLAALLQVAVIDACPFAQLPPVAGARWVLPRLVGEVRYSSRTRAGRLRHPSWHRLRPDLAPANPLT
ncbi:ATP-dependent DNA ligase [Streptomyces sp. SM13]|uniref:ATP-dependent DNA ligase n=1 Tax=Streptomyces sp. SM13 TaxID=1983803 RepID=UPI0035BC5A9B